MHCWIHYSVLQEMSPDTVHGSFSVGTEIIEELIPIQSQGSVNHVLACDGTVWTMYGPLLFPHYLC